ncbi:MAG: Nucleoid-associated protein YbaB [Holosporales bacterium]
MKNIGQMMKQAQALQSKMTDLQEQLKEYQDEGSSGAGMVKMTINGKGEIVSVKIDPTLLNPAEVDILEDLIVAAFRDGKEKVETYVNAEMNKITGGLGDFKLPF